jgi:hypothetical protein
MTHNLVDEMICHFFEKEVGKGQNPMFGEKKGSKKALHMGFNMTPDYAKKEQYRVVHMYIYAPMNYVYVAVQEERIDAKGNRHVGKMKILSYHDSCWRSAISEWVYENRDEINSFNSFKLGELYDVIEISDAEEAYLEDANKHRCNHLGKDDEHFPGDNPWDDRGIWAGKCDKTIKD